MDSTLLGNESVQLSAWMPQLSLNSMLMELSAEEAPR